MIKSNLDKYISKIDKVIEKKFENSLNRTFQINDYTYLFNWWGQVILKTKENLIGYFENKYLIFKRGAYFVVTNLRGEILFKKRCLELEFLREDYFTFKTSSGVGLLDKYGSVLIKPKYKELKFAYINTSNHYIDTFEVKNSDDEVEIIDARGNKIQGKRQDKKNNNIIDLGCHSFYSRGDYFAQDKTGKWGLIKETGEIVFDYKYLSIDTIFMFNIDEIYYHAQNEKGLWGIIDKDENIVIPFKYDYIAKRHFANNTFIASYNNKYGVIDINGNTKIDFKYEKLLNINTYGDGFLAQYKDNNGTWTIINDKDETINLDLDNIPEIKITKKREPQSVNIPKNLKKSDFVIDNFDTWGYSDKFTKGKYSYYLNSDFKISFKTKYREFERFDNFIIFETDDNKKFVADNNGNILIKPIYQDIEFLYADDYIKYQKNDKWGIIKANGKILTEAKYDDIDFDTKNYFTVELNDKKGVIDKFENIILPFEYDNLSFFDDVDKIAVKKNDKFGVVNLKNEIIIPFVYDFIDNWHNKYNKNLISASIDEKYGLIDWDNNIILPFEFASISIISDIGFFGNKEPMDCINYLYDFKGNKICNTSFDGFWRMEDEKEVITDYYIASSRHENQYGLADKFGNPIIDFKYKEFSPTYSKKHNKFYFIVKNNLGAYGIVDIQDNTIIPFIYDDLKTQNIDCGIIAIINDKTGLIDLENNVLIDFIFSELDLIKNSEYFVAKGWQNKTGHKAKLGIVNKYGESIKINLKNIKELKI